MWGLEFRVVVYKNHSNDSSNSNGRKSQNTSNNAHNSKIGIRVKSGWLCVEGNGLASLVQAHICMKGLPRSFVQT